MVDIHAALQTPKIDVHGHVFRSTTWERSSDLLVECADRLGITEVWCSSPIMGGRIGTAEEVRAENNVVRQSVGRHPGRIRGLCFVIPGPDALPELERCLDAGMIGIKLYNQYRINDPIVRPVIELAIERRVPILEHAGYPAPEHRSRQPLISHGIHFAEVNGRYPDAIIYHAHMGGGGDWEHTIRALRDGSPNLYIDVSGSNLDRDQVGFAVEELGAERVLFGTDGTMAGSVGKVIDADVTEEAQELIWRGNAARILAAQGLTPTDPATVSNSVPPVSIVSDARPAPRTVEPSPGKHLFDTNAWLGSHPFRSVTATADTLLAEMDRCGIARAAVSSIESIFHRNVQPANERLFDQVAPHGDRLIPLATVTPGIPKWEQDLARAVDAGAKGIRLVPQYHDYRLNGPVGRRVIEAVVGAGLPIMLPHRIEDFRQRHWMDPGAVLDLGDIADAIAAFPEATFVINNARQIWRSPLWRREAVRKSPNWYLDLSLAEIHYTLHHEVDTARDLANVVDEGGAGHLVFGTHWPFSYVAPALVKLETLHVDDDTRAAIAGRSAAAILGLEKG